MGAEMTGAQSLKQTTDDIADRWSGHFVYEASTGVEYAIYMEFGTRPHDITPNTAPALHFWVNGVEVYTDFVRHPGTEPRAFMRPAAEATARQSGEMVATSNDLRELTEALAERVRDLARAYAPKDEGTLAASITVRRVS